MSRLSYYGEYKNMVQRNSDVREEKLRLSKDVYRGIDTGSNYSARGNTRSEKTCAYFCGHVEANLVST